MNIKLLNEHNLEFLGLKEGYTGSSESIHVTLLEITCCGSKFSHSIRSNKDELYIFKIFLKVSHRRKRQSKTLILSTNVDETSLETGFSIATCRPIFD